MKTRSAEINPIVILGATGSGKTGLAVALAKKLNGEIISADSRQVYKYLNVGTNKEGELKKGFRYTCGIKQHLTDIIEPNDTYNAGSFAKDAEELISDLIKQDKTPIITGGTGLYIKALIDGLASLPEADEKIRAKLQKDFVKHGKEYLYETLKKFDPESAQKNRSNPQRLIRAIEVYKITGKPITFLQKQTIPSKRKFLQFGIEWDRETLYKNLDARCRVMLENGMIEETRKLLKRGFKESSPALCGIGYGHIVKYLKGEMKKEEVLELFSRDMRRYAKRQLTWFNADKRITWIDNSNSFSKKLNKVFKSI